MIVFEKTKGLTDNRTNFCPGCTHGIIERIIAETIVELGELGNTLGVAPVGCAVMAYEHFNFDMQQAAHGRAPAVATGIKRVLPDRTVFTYQGDGDLAAIGMGEIIHAASRSENFTTIFVNNAIYGMTGGQMAPTTLVGQKSTTTSSGRSTAINGSPIKVAEMIATIEGSVYVERVSVHNPAHVNKAKRAIKKAFELQLKNKGFTFIEVLSTCPINWGISPTDSLGWLAENMIPKYPLGIYKNISEEA